MADELAKLVALRQSGVLSEDEFDVVKARLFTEFPALVPSVPAMPGPQASEQPPMESLSTQWPTVDLAPAQHPVLGVDVSGGADLQSENAQKRRTRPLAWVLLAIIAVGAVVALVAGLGGHGGGSVGRRGRLVPRDGDSIHPHEWRHAVRNGGEDRRSRYTGSI